MNAATHQPDDVILRPSRWLTAIGGGFCIGLSLFMFALIVRPDQSIGQLLFASLLVLLSLVGFVNFFWFNYVRIGESSIEQVRLLGLQRRCIALSDVSRVDLTGRDHILMTRMPTLRIDHTKGSMEFSVANVHEAYLYRAAIKLEQIGAPVSLDVIPRLRALQGRWNIWKKW